MTYEEFTELSRARLKDATILTEEELGIMWIALNLVLGEMYGEGAATRLPVAFVDHEVHWMMARLLVDTLRKMDGEKGS